MQYSPNNKTKIQPVQFSFTLYDLEGNGKITKDDIAGIVTTIYDSIGKNVSVPHNGKKKINVKLTVSSENPKPIQQDTTFRKKYYINAQLSDEENDSEPNSNSDQLEQSNIKQNILKNSVTPLINQNQEEKIDKSLISAKRNVKKKNPNRKDKLKSNRVC